MALYQPTNVIPSSYTKGTVDVNDIMEISWQVNGNSAMTAFQIDFYLNDYASTPVTSTGKQLVDNFYGTDRFGRPQFFTWNSKVSWEDNGFTNGNEYKYKITQWYEGKNEVVSCVQIFSWVAGRVYYFEVTQGQYAGAIISFTAVANMPSSTYVTIYFSFTNGECWYMDGDRVIVLNGIINESGNIPNNATRLTGAPRLGTQDEFFITQTSSNIFVTRDKPTLTIYRSNEQYSGKIEFPNEGDIATSIGFFKAEYEQLQGDPIRWIRWQVASANNGTVGEILADTGDIYTPTLNFEYNGFFNGQQYAIRCIGESESGQECNSSPDTEGWIYFNINIENQGQYDGNFTVQCLNKEDATLLEWEGVEAIPPTVSPQGYEPTISSGSVMLNGKNGDTEYLVAWDKKIVIENGESKAIPLDFSAPWAIAWRGNIKLEYTRLIEQISGEANRQTVIDGKTYWYYQQTLPVSSDINKILKIDVRAYPSGTLSQTKLYQTSGRNYVTVTLLSETPVILSGDIYIYVGELTSPKGELFTALSSDHTQFTIIQNSDSTSNRFTINLGSVSIDIPIQGFLKADKVAIVINPFNVTAYFFDSNSLISTYSKPIIYSQDSLASVQISGGENGATVDSVSVFNNADKQLDISNYDNPDFEPVWNDPNYKLYMAANFNGNLEGGTGTATGTGFRVYRQEVGKNVLTPIATVPSTVTSVKDYGIVSRKAYKYSLYAYDNNGAFMSSVENEKVVATCFKNYSLLVCDYDETNDEYHVRKQYLFALNLSAGSVGNNNSPTLNANFTQYPTRMPSTQNYASGTLQGLIGAIYTVPALIEQIGNYKRTTKLSTMDYFDNVDLEKELYDLSTAPYQLFLRDMKGRLRMIATNGAISMTTNIKQKQQSISMSLPWVEIGDASDVTIIQTPDDYGWNNDNQVLDVQLDVDVATGELSATYPFPYNSTKFYLTGVNKETLTAKSPLGITPAQFNLSEVAEKTTDGEVTATVKVKTENSQ